MDDAVRSSSGGRETDSGNHPRQPLGPILRVVPPGFRFGEVSLVYVLSIEVRQSQSTPGIFRLLAYSSRRKESRFILGRQEWGVMLDAAVEDVEGDLSVSASHARNRILHRLIQFWHRISQGKTG